MLKIGLTGNIAAGKSEAEKIISNLNYKIVDLDKISHNLLLNNNNIKSKVLSTFKTLDRKEIAAIVFSNSEEKEKLDNIFFPCLRDFTINYFRENKNQKAVFISGALLLEAGFEDLFDKIIYINAPHNVRLSRLMKRNNLDETEAKKRMDCQKDCSKKADFIVQNDKDIKNLEEKITEIFDKLML